MQSHSMQAAAATMLPNSACPHQVIGRMKIVGEVKWEQKMKLLRLGVGVGPPSVPLPLVVAAVMALSPICFPPGSVGQTMGGVEEGAASSLFRKACIGCHDGGGNIIQPGATLFLKDLQRNGVDAEEEIYRVTYYGKGRMPGFGEKCTPRGQCTFGPRLTEIEIKMLAEFVKAQAQQGWPNSNTPH